MYLIFSFHWVYFQVPVDLVIDHSVQVDVARSENAVQANMELEFQRNKEREGLLYPDSVVGTDSHTTMIDGLGVAGWGVGGIEAEATMLGQPMSMALPGVVGFKLSGKLRNGVTAVDLVLTVTQMLRKHGVVGKFVEFYGDGMAELSLADRATIANMSPEYGATMGFFPVDHVTLQPHDRVPLKEMKLDWHSCLDNKVGFKGFAVPKDRQEKVVNFSFHGQDAEIKHGNVVIAAITSCTNTSNPSVMLGAALVAKKACDLGLHVKPWVKTSLAPGSGVVTKYLLQSGLQKYLNQQGFNIVGYGCTTCIRNSGDLDESVSSAISENDIVAAAVLSGNRNFEGRVHPLTRANYLASPPLVVAYALAGTVDIDFEKEPIGMGKDGKNVYFRDIWPSTEEIAEVVQSSVLPDMFKSTYEAITKGNNMWNQLSVPFYITFRQLEPSTKIALLLSTLMSGGLIAGTSTHMVVGGNDEIMARDTFANIRIVTKLLNGEVGPKTIHIPTGEKLSVFDAAMKYKSAGQDTIILAGAEYGSGSSRDWAAKGPMLLGVKAVIAKSFERIHRSNLVGMGIVPLCFKAGEDAETLGLTGHERFTIDLPDKISEIRPGQDVTVRTDTEKSFTCVVRFDTEIERQQRI
ncbi:hypothetical protein K7X08_015304 [Anisodus acutangulus]|uniref:aconitate hydratase n=1 Tax=Anisodus acutangulus TaxID=402998 RepID=A0A9Q1L6H3_9SOLA|nr:hypothetical protein K7X08_015304 [Anisodus acutangulus]